MRSDTAACLDRFGEIVVPFPYFGRGVLQNTGNEAHLVGGVDREERRRGTAEVVQAHGFAEPCLGAAPDDIVDPASRERTAFPRGPKPIMVCRRPRSWGLTTFR